MSIIIKLMTENGKSHRLISLPATADIQFFTKSEDDDRPYMTIIANSVRLGNTTFTSRDKFYLEGDVFVMDGSGNNISKFQCPNRPFSGTVVVKQESAPLPTKLFDMKPLEWLIYSYNVGLAHQDGRAIFNGQGGLIDIFKKGDPVKEAVANNLKGAFTAYFCYESDDLIVGTSNGVPGDHYYLANAVVWNNHTATTFWVTPELYKKLGGEALTGFKPKGLPFVNIIKDKEILEFIKRHNNLPTFSSGVIEEMIVNSVIKDLIQQNIKAISEADVSEEGKKEAEKLLPRYTVDEYARDAEGKVIRGPGDIPVLKHRKGDINLTKLVNNWTPPTGR